MSDKTQIIHLNNNAELENFNPFDTFKEDMVEFQKLDDTMRDISGLDISVAETLAGRHLRAADRCNEILSTLSKACKTAKTQKNNIKGRLFLRSKDEGFTTVAERTAFVECHDEFLLASRILNNFESFKEYYERKFENLLNGHRLCKEKLKNELKQMPLSGFPENTNRPCGEKEW